MQKNRKNSESTIDIFTEKERKIEQLCTLSMRNMCIYIYIYVRKKKRKDGRKTNNSLSTELQPGPRVSRGS